jgi:hypothetical protein
MLCPMANVEKTGTAEDGSDGLLSMQEVADRARVTTYTIRRAVKAGVLRRANANLRKPPRFSEEAVLDYIAEREGGTGTALVATGGGLQTKEAVELARADALTSMVAQSHGHTENAWTQVNAMVSEMRRHSGDMLAAAHAENERLRGRITHLEEAHDDVQAALDKLREHAFDVEVAKGQAEVNKRRNETAMGVVKLLAPAVMGALLGGPAGDVAKEGAMSNLFDSMSQEQKDIVMQSLSGVFSADQMAALMLILSKAAAKERVA